jgi:hypothetical protein
MSFNLLQFDKHLDCCFPHGLVFRGPSRALAEEKSRPGAYSERLFAVTAGSRPVPLLKFGEARNARLPEPLINRLLALPLNCRRD